MSEYCYREYDILGCYSRFRFLVCIMMQFLLLTLSFCITFEFLDIVSLYFDQISKGAYNLYLCYCFQEPV